MGHHRKVSFIRAINVKLVEYSFEVSNSGNHGMGGSKTVQRSVKTLPDKKRVVENKDALIEESIHAIRSKKKIEKIARLRAAISVSSSEKMSVSENAVKRPAHSSGDALSDYGSIVKALIHSRWIYPEVIKEDLSCRVVFEIMMNGDVRIIEVESSGNRLFDYSARNAIMRSIPFPFPPEPVEMEVRFSR